MKNNKSLPYISGYHCSDLAGKWEGTAQNRNNTIFLKLDVDQKGHVIGSGVQANWDIDEMGKVTGGGSFSFMNGTNHFVVKATWMIKLSKAKLVLSGKFIVSHEKFNKLRIQLKKRHAHARS